VKVWGLHDYTGCGYYRVGLPLAALAANGHTVGLSREWIDQALDYPTIIGQRVGIGMRVPWRRLRATHRLVYEVDDDFWNIDPAAARLRTDMTAAKLDAMEQAIRVAHLAIATNDFLADRLRRHNPNVAVLPNWIDARLLDVHRPRRDKVTIGWAGGDTHHRDLAMIAPHLRRFLRRHPDVEFHNIGSNYLTRTRIPGRHTAWFRDVWDYYRAVDFDIGLAPLVPTVFARSKTPVKALEYAALGIPVIASDCDVYRSFVLDGVTGYLVRRDHEWELRLRDLVNDDAMRAEMGAKAKAHAVGWTIQRNWRHWETALEAA
jgi:glycosyltransferase involved in cell wall biosynthesis